VATAQERDALLDHIYEYGTAAEGVLERIRKLCRAAAEIGRRCHDPQNNPPRTFDRVFGACSANDHCTRGAWIDGCRSAGSTLHRSFPMTLPADVARCIGTDLPECTTCRRRTDPPHERQVWTGPWELEGVPCEMRIPSDQNRTQSVKNRGHAWPAGSRPAHSGRTF
jgi:hypothetical protein